MTTQFMILFGLAILASGIFTITAKNPVISVIYLIATFVFSAGLLLKMGIKFIALSYIVVYVGAITVLFLFVLMMIDIRVSEISESGVDFTQHLPLAVAIVSLFIFILLNFITFDLLNNGGLTLLHIRNTTYWFYQDMGNSMKLLIVLYQNMNNPDILIAANTEIAGFGQIMFTEFACLFITVGMVLLLAMFSAISTILIETFSS
uniref:NADH dehydrogenase subunit 6 n=1 Tax=Cyathus striatus TaxID=68777 RepID=UPI0023F40585|nr:NADH dehydrogenase subunit 6 [Cyathus striatus]WDS46409.1 NADH dehydrogenase subunit 6 [Cyathus striatus]